MVIFWAVIILWLAYALGTLQGLSPELRRALLESDPETKRDHTMGWLLLLAVITTIYLGVMGL